MLNQTGMIAYATNILVRGAEQVSEPRNASMKLNRVEADRNASLKGLH